MVAVNESHEVIASKPGYQTNFLTPTEFFYEVTRSRPYRLSDEGRKAAGLTPETWRLEIVGDDDPWRPILKKTYRVEDGTALTYADLEGLFRGRPVRVRSGRGRAV